MNLLFVCAHNRFRSKVAEAIFNKLNNNKKNIAKGAGMRMDFMYPYVAENVHKVLAEREYKIKDEIPEQITDEAIEWADKIIIVADNVAPEIFSGKNVEVWKIKDCDQEDIEGIREIVGQIEKRVMRLIKKLSS